MHSYSQEMMETVTIGDPFVVQINLTTRCTLRCPYCYLRNTKVSSIDINSLKLFLLKFKKWTQDYNFQLHINLTGGDLWLYPEIKEICEFVYCQNFIKSISLLINNLWYKDSKNIILAIKDKIDAVQINVDVVESRLDDIVFLQKENIKTVVKIMLAKCNDFERQIKIVNKLKEINPKILVSVDRFCPQEFKDYKYVLKTQDLIKILLKLKHIFKFLVSDDPLVNALLKSNKSKKELEKNKMGEDIRGCIIPNGGLAVYPDNTIKLCSRISKFQTDFTIFNFDLIKYIQKFNHIRDNISKDCFSCKIFSLCRGGCPATSYIKNKKFEKDIQCIRNYYATQRKF
jgi:radical SAM protein with 4Fe4S-binding SPASM domain